LITVRKWNEKERNMISKTDMAWMAAVIDLKGGIIRKNNKKRKTPQTVLIVDCKDARIAVRLSQLTGTAPEPHNQAPMSEFLRRGCREHCKTPHIHVYDEEHPWSMPQTTRWTITGAAMAVVLLNIAPYMSTYEEYRGYVDQAMSVMVTEGQGSGQVRASIRRLSELGWHIPARIAKKTLVAVA
jgi:hypothetical protein